MFKASLNDVSDFKEILQMKLPAIKEAYKIKKRVGRGAARGHREGNSPPGINEDLKNFEKIILQTSKKTL